MDIRSYLLRLFLVFAACASFQARADFDALERGIGFQVNGSVVFQDYDLSRSSFRSESASSYSFGFEQLSGSLVLPALSMSSPAFVAEGASIGVASSTFDGRTLTFNAQARAEMNGSAPIGSLSANSASVVSFGSRFTVVPRQDAWLHVLHAIGINATYDFSLIRDGTVVWTQHETYDSSRGSTPVAAGLPLLLDPGYYELQAVLRAMAGIAPGEEQSISTADVAFTLSLVPELGTAYLWLPGVLVLVFARRKASISTLLRCSLPITLGTR